MANVIRLSDLDLNALARMRAEARREGFKFVERLCEDWWSNQNRFARSGEALFAVFDGSDIVGICGLNEDPYVQDARIGRIRRLYVVPQHRRKGIAAALLTAALEHARGHFDTLRVHTDCAGDFYLRQGFSQTDGLEKATHVIRLKRVA